VKKITADDAMLFLFILHNELFYILHQSSHCHKFLVDKKLHFAFHQQ